MGWVASLERKAGVTFNEIYSLKLPKSEIDRIKAEFVGFQYTRVLSSYVTNKSSIENFAEVFKAYHNNLDKILNVPTYGISESIQAESMFYLSAQLARTRLKSFLLYNDANDKNTFGLISKDYQGILREKLILQYFRSSNYYDGYLDDFAKGKLIVKDDQNRKILLQLRRVLRGETINNFCLSDTLGNKVCLNDFKGKTVFIDFWFTGCGACAMYYDTVIKPVREMFKGDPTVVFVSISVDLNREKWLNSIKSGQYTSRDEINLYTQQMGFAFPFLKEYNINLFPCPIVIGASGKVYSFDTSDLREKDSLYKIINEAKKVF